MAFTVRCRGETVREGSDAMDVTISSMVMENKVFTEVLSNLQLKQYKRDIHFNKSISNLQKVEMKNMYTALFELL